MVLLWTFCPDVTLVTGSPLLLLQPSPQVHLSPNHGLYRDCVAQALKEVKTDDCKHIWWNQPSFMCSVNNSSRISHVHILISLHVQRHCSEAILRELLWVSYNIMPTWKCTWHYENKGCALSHNECLFFFYVALHVFLLMINLPFSISQMWICLFQMSSFPSGRQCGPQPESWGPGPPPPLQLPDTTVHIAVEGPETTATDQVHSLLNPLLNEPLHK